MKENLLITFFLCTFAKWIDGSREPLIRVIQQPFHFAYLLESLNVGIKMKKLTTQEFIERARVVHGDKYDYSRVIYVNRRTRIIIGCPTHGFGLQYPDKHLSSCGCQQCAIEKRAKQAASNKEEFVKKAREVHGSDYVYDNVFYVNSKTPIEILCPTHGMFKQTPSSHLSGQGCPTCGLLKISQKKMLTQEHVIDLFRKIHPIENYDYSKVIYTGNNKKVEIVCPKHGSFFQTPVTHIYNKCGCPLCAAEIVGLKERKSRQAFIAAASKVHNGKYSYDLVPYNFLSSDKIPIICPTHGVFYQNANNHMRGSGCPHCPKTIISVGEEKVRMYLDNMGIDYIPQYKIPNEDLFCENKNLYIDFYIPSKNIFIEYNGEQHYNEYYYFGGVGRLERQQARDMALRQYCKEHKIKLIEIPYWDFDNIETILKKELKTK